MREGGKINLFKDTWEKK